MQVYMKQIHCFGNIKLVRTCSFPCLIIFAPLTTFNNTAVTDRFPITTYHSSDFARTYSSSDLARISLSTKLKVVIELAR